MEQESFCGSLDLKEAERESLSIHLGSLLTPETTKLWWIKGNHRIQIFDEKGTFIRTFGSEDNDDGRLIDPSGVAIDQEGNYVVSNDFCIQVFDSAGKFLRKFGSEGEGNGQFNFLLEFCQMKILWWVGDFLGKWQMSNLRPNGQLCECVWSRNLVFSKATVCGFRGQYFGCK